MKHGFSLRLKNIIGLSIFAAVMQFPLAADAGCLNWLRQLVGLAPKASITVPAKMASQLGYPLKYKVLVPPELQAGLKDPKKLPRPNRLQRSSVQVATSLGTIQNDTIATDLLLNPLYWWFPGNIYYPLFASEAKVVQILTFGEPLTLSEVSQATKLTYLEDPRWDNPESAVVSISSDNDRAYGAKDLESPFPNQNGQVSSIYDDRIFNASPVGQDASTSTDSAPRYSVELPTQEESERRYTSTPQVESYTPQTDTYTPPPADTYSPPSSTDSSSTPDYSSGGSDFGGGDSGGSSGGGFE
jgi:uncharacterized membrane protein YgcG